MLAPFLLPLAFQGLQPPFRAEAGGTWIDMDTGHAAPLIVDWDGDGLDDLLVGQFGAGGRLRVYRSHGRPGAPRFEDFEWYQTEDGLGKVPVG